LEHNIKNVIRKTPTTMVKQKALKHEFSKLGLGEIEGEEETMKKQQLFS
jgi:hypothetical protein